MSRFWECWTRFIRWLPWPMEESAPSDAMLLLVGTLPFFALTLGVRLLGVPIGWRFASAFILAIGVRVVPWFKRPESYHLNALVGWILAEIVGVFIWHHP
jgi:hypothetical protein